MKKLLYILIMCVCPLLVMAQGQFSCGVTKLSDKELLVTARALLEDEWHVSDHAFHFDKLEGAKAGKTAERTVHTAAGDSVVYTLRIMLTGQNYVVRGYLDYTLCTDRECLAPQQAEFVYQGTVASEDKQGGSDETAFSSDEMAENEKAEAADSASALVKNIVAGTEGDTIDTWAPVIDQLRAFEQGGVGEGADATAGNLLQVFLLAFGAGLLALLTPCVWPIIPLTMSFFLKQSDKEKKTVLSGARGAVFFGLCIVLIFLTLGIVVTALLGADAMNTLATSAVFNVVCFIVLVAFGLSLMGFFELRLPQSWATALDNKSSATTGALSIMLMALTLVVVSFSCTAPIIGLVLVEVVTAANSTSNITAFIPASIGMLGFALALALPFTVFALFPSWLKRMPRSGQWMTHVRVTLGVIEVAFSLKFLSVADMAYGWGILPRWLFVLIWVVLAFGLGLYHCMGWGKSSSRWQLFVAAVCMSLGVSIANDYRRDDLDWLSAFLPPAEVDATHIIYKDYDEALQASRRTGKPVFVDFTGYGCVNCRKMEGAVFSNKTVQQTLSDNFIVVQLYVDDRTPLPQHIRAYGRTLRTVGDRWASLEQHKFGSMAQPFYVILNADGQPLTRSYAYDESVDAFLAWLHSAH